MHLSIPPRLKSLHVLPQTSSKAGYKQQGRYRTARTTINAQKRTFKHYCKNKLISNRQSYFSFFYGPCTISTILAIFSRLLPRSIAIFSRLLPRLILSWKIYEYTAWGIDTKKKSPSMFNSNHTESNAVWWWWWWHFYKQWLNYTLPSPFR